MKVINAIGEVPKQVYAIEIKAIDEKQTYYAPTKVFLKEETAEKKKNKLLEVFHDIEAKVVPVELVED